MSAMALEGDRTVALLEAQRQAHLLFDEIERSLVRPGITESVLSRDIHALAAERFGVATHWHKRVIRTGPNTLRPYYDEPPDLVIGADDILFVDLGPVFEAWEADFGRTYVLGSDPVKRRLREALEPAFRDVKRHFEAAPDITGAELYAAACRHAAEAGWEFGGTIAGHVVGEFPHERIPNDRVSLYITRGNDKPIRSVNGSGMTRHWILEIHLVDRAREIGGFYEELLKIGTPDH